jgi:hypothetical protein
MTHSDATMAVSDSLTAAPEHSFGQRLPKVWITIPNFALIPGLALRSGVEQTSSEFTLARSWCRLPSL